MTATPVQNARADLAAQLALFLGRAAWSLTDDGDRSRTSCAALRQADGAAADMPRLDGPHLVSLDHGRRLLDELLALAAADSGERRIASAAALLTYGLVHQWTSSRAALVAALERRRGARRGAPQRARDGPSSEPRRDGRVDAVRRGRAARVSGNRRRASPAPRTTTSPTFAPRSSAPAAVESLLERLRRARESRRRSRGGAPRTSGADTRASGSSRSVTTPKPFTRCDRCSRATPASRRSPRRARVWPGDACRATSVIAQFAPRGAAGRETPRAERIDLLITTDVLSEG